MLGSGQQAVHFPTRVVMPEGRRHLELRILIFDFLRLAFGELATIGSDQFVYWDPTSPRVCLAPDAFVFFGAKDEQFDSWKVWERGVPQVAIEVVSESETDLSWDEKFARYQRLGVSELVWFDPGAPERPLRIWDFVGDDLLERRLPAPLAHSRHLGGYWLPIEEPNGGLTLRLSRDPQGLLLFPTLAELNAQRFQAEAEAHRAEAEAGRAEAEARRVAEHALRVETEARRAAEQRIVELEAELKRRS
ncbi:MAG TPA: Uma2 family endonuclease [Polyangiaceae bacterium]